MDKCQNGMENMVTEKNDRKIDFYYNFQCK